jgi:hypothetical protein
MKNVLLTVSTNEEVWGAQFVSTVTASSMTPSSTAAQEAAVSTSKVKKVKTKTKVQQTTLATVKKGLTPQGMASTVTAEFWVPNVSRGPDGALVTGT